MSNPVVFVSYSRESEEHSAWVRHLSERLRSHGIDSRLDQWHLAPGDDLVRFMTSAVRDSDFVLLICTPNYAAKANEDRGGVGFEGSVIAGSILTVRDSQGKFIPVLRSGTAAESIPVFLWNRLWVDFTEDASFSASVEHLARHLLRRPEIVPPPVAPAAVPGGVNRLRRPDRWILVAGTGNRDRLPERMEEVCRELGRELAGAGFGLVTGGWPGVDRSVSMGFASSLETLGLPLENFLTQVVEQTWDPPFRAGRIIPVPPGEAEYIESVKRADAGILVGGVGGTYRTGEYLRVSGKPVFPVPESGGDARKFFKRMAGKWYEGCIPNVTKAQYMGLDAGWPEAVGRVTRLLALWNQR